MTAFTVHITKVETGETRELEVPGPRSWDASKYIWTEGNFGCDCNRELFFSDGIGEPRTAKITTCGQDRFRIRVTEDGSERFNENEETT